MEIVSEKHNHLKLIAEEVLGNIEKIGGMAEQALSQKSSLGSQALAYSNTLNDTSTTKELGKQNRETKASYKVLAKEPVIARILVEDDSGVQEPYYISRATPINGSSIKNIASYRAPVGRLAALPIGEEFQFPNGRKVEVVERSLLTPEKKDNKWDSINTIYENETLDTQTIESLRSLLTVDEFARDLLAEIMAEEDQSQNIVQGKRRSILTKMGLRDQPILDKYQDNIFRMPLDTKYLLLGPPGTGKTTTLIRRLGHKLEWDSLDEHEQYLLKNRYYNNHKDHSKSWLMFTPTELLKQYLKEAFAREEIPASDYQIKTWKNYRLSLARNTFDILKTSTGKGTFIVKENSKSLHSDALENSIDWFNDFDNWQKSYFVTDLKHSAQYITDKGPNNLHQLGLRLSKAISHAKNSSWENMFLSFSAERESLQELLVDLKDESDHIIQESLRVLLRDNNEFVNELVAFLNNLEVDERENQEIEDEEDIIPTQNITPKMAVTGYINAIKSLARLTVQKKKLTTSTKAGNVVAWLGDRGPKKDDLIEIGTNLFLQSHLRQFANPLKRFLDGVSRRYKLFKKIRLNEGKWYSEKQNDQNHINPLEVDLLILTILKTGSNLLKSKTVATKIDSPVWHPLERVYSLYEDQILVDEITDFSPVQIACIEALANPFIGSFFSCGDFNQRLTPWGTKTKDDMLWSVRDLKYDEVTVSYRQTQQLNNFTKSLVNVTGGTGTHITLPDYTDNEGVAPALLECGKDYRNTALWLAERINEIENTVGTLPTIAIFVNSEDQVQALTDELEASLANYSIPVLACLRGKMLGSEDTNVRVYDIQHIKGLEFEAVFLVGIDKISNLHSSLLTKFLYVGTTRAATYLGLTCMEQLPPVIDDLRPSFVENWK